MKFNTRLTIRLPYFPSPNHPSHGRSASSPSLVVRRREQFLSGVTVPSCCCNSSSGGIRQVAPLDRYSPLRVQAAKTTVGAFHSSETCLMILVPDIQRREPVNLGERCNEVSRQWSSTLGRHCGAVGSLHTTFSASRQTRGKSNEQVSSSGN